MSSRLTITIFSRILRFCKQKKDFVRPLTSNHCVLVNEKSYILHDLIKPLCLCTTHYSQCSGSGLKGLDAGKWFPLLTGCFLSTPQMPSALHTGRGQLTGKELSSSTNHMI